MKRSKNHDKLCASAKPHIFAGKDEYGPHWLRSDIKGELWDYQSMKGLCDSIRRGRR